MPSIASMKSNEAGNHSLASFNFEENSNIYKTVTSEHIAKDVQEIKLIVDATNNSRENVIDNTKSNYYSNAENLTQVYFKRWIILFIFSFISLLSAFNWIEYNIIQDVTISFYNASLPEGEIQQNDAVNWFSMVYMLCYIPLVFPAMFLLDKKGLKLSCVLGALLTTV